MPTSDWINVKEILSEVLTLEPDERQKFLIERNVEPEVRREIEEFLAVEHQANSFMSVTASRFTMDLLTDEIKNSQNVLAGQRIGIYQIIREVDSGGMGTVYLAERIDGKFEQKVAVKMLRREFNFERVRQTFKREKEILSKLVHPYIARMLDAGTTDEGVPFLVMEYIEGFPVDIFCERENLDLKSRLKIFNKICEAVSFSHHNLIVHRDLKPSNILVTEDGAPKLLDFGISKLLDANLPEAENPVTVMGAMTPEYASPEQIKGENITIATDIYSLGVILNKILTGSLPYKLKGKSSGEIFKTIAEIELSLPSKIIVRKSNQETPITGSQLGGDLDNIILKALCKEPALRYRTVDQFSNDIWRFIDGKPVAARPATLFYRMDKFARRHKILIAAGMLAFLSLIGGAAVAVWQAKVAQEQAQIAIEAQKQTESESIKARIEAEKARKVSEFMIKITSFASPRWNELGSKYNGETKVIEAMNDLSEQIDVEFADYPDTQAELHHKFGEIFSRPQFKEKQRFHIRRALELRRKFYGEKHEFVAKDLFYLYLTLDENDQEQAVILMRAIQMMRETNPNNLNLPYMLEAYSNRLASFNYAPEVHAMFRRAVMPPTDENNYQIAERMRRESLPIFRLHYKEDNYAVISAECYLAYLLAVQNKWTDFDEHFTLCKKNVTKIPDNSLKWHREIVKSIEKLLAEGKEKIN